MREAEFGLSCTTSPTYSCDLSKPIREHGLSITRPLSHTASLTQVGLSHTASLAQIGLTQICPRETVIDYWLLISLQIGLSRTKSCDLCERGCVRERPCAREAVCERDRVQERPIY